MDFTSVQVKDEQSNLLTTLYPSTEKYYYDLSIGTLRSYDSHNYIYLDFLNEDIIPDGELLARLKEKHKVK